jgi:hypothetical protein
LAFGAGGELRDSYCFKRPQYFWVPLSQQPVFLHIALRTPQLVTQIDMVDLSGFFLQLLMQMLSSPLHRMGAARTVWAQSNAIPRRAITPVTILCRAWSGRCESARRSMLMV